jgi:CRISPR-associated protein Cst1
VDPVSATAPGTPLPLTMTGHPLQRAGAWAVAVLSQRRHPQDVTRDDLDQIASRLVDDVCTAATARSGTAAYDWWKVLFALYPNSKATHSRRPGTRAELEADIAALFAPDSDDGTAAHPCTFCGTPTSSVWTKTNLPMFDTNKAVNTLPPAVAGWPVCRGCRIAAWALPYGAWVTAGSATVLSCESEDAERRFAERNVLRARRVMQFGFGKLPAGSRPELVALNAVRYAGAELAASTLWSFKNDNQEPWLRVTHTRRAAPRFIAIVQGNAPLRRGWRLLELALTRRGAGGEVTTSGPAEAARLLFEYEEGGGRSFLLHLHRVASDSGTRLTPAHRVDLTRLAFTYAKEILGMEPDLTPVATMVADWIQHGDGSPRGRWAEFESAHLDPYKLGLVLSLAKRRLYMAGRHVATHENQWRPLIQRRPRSWEQRMLLGMAVVRTLQERGVAVSRPPADPEEEARTERLLQQPPFSDEDDPMGAV